MVVLEDFTQAISGQEIPCAGLAVCCPRCGRPGLRQSSEEGSNLFVHSQLSEVLGDGMRIEPQDCCTVASAYSGAG